MPAPSPRNPEEKPRDVLAAEEFAVPYRDPGLREEPPHDVLAAEEFAVGYYDPELHHRGPVSLPEDPTGIAEPHDVLAAEEFAMPAPHYGSAPPRSASRGRLAWILGAAVLIAFWLGRRSQ